MRIVVDYAGTPVVGHEACGEDSEGSRFECYAVGELT